MTESSIRLIVLMVSLCFVLWLTANRFDSSEVKTLCMFFLSAASLEGGTNYLKGLLKKSE